MARFPMIATIIGDPNGTRRSDLRMTGCSGNIHGDGLADRRGSVILGRRERFRLIKRSTALPKLKSATSSQDPRTSSYLIGNPRGNQKV